MDLCGLYARPSQRLTLLFTLLSNVNCKMPLMSRMFKMGYMTGLGSLANDPEAYKARQMDLHAVLKWTPEHCKANFKVLLGHSMGARTVMFEVGAINTAGIKGQDRFDAYVALSPAGHGTLFEPGAWAHIQKPVLNLTGTEDKLGYDTWEPRKEPYDNMPPGCKWFGLIDGATHTNFAGVGSSKRTEELTVATTLEFLKDVMAKNCQPPAPLPGMKLLSK